jgi:hypothetical protein
MTDNRRQDEDGLVPGGHHEEKDKLDAKSEVMEP